jgi:hypothetical protein
LYSQRAIAAIARRGTSSRMKTTARRTLPSPATRRT